MKIFIAGTGTEVGKTLITGFLARYLKNGGEGVVTQKWVQTGCAGNVSCDVSEHLYLMGAKNKDYAKYLSCISPFVYRTASSPHLASKIEKIPLSISKIKKSFYKLSKSFKNILVEGTGGVMVPLNSSRLYIDLVAELKIPVLLVSGNYLGSINHTLLTLEALKSRKIKLLGIIFNNCFKDEEPFILEDNPKIVSRFSGVKVIGTLNFRQDSDVLYKDFFPIAGRLFKSFKDG